MSLQMTAPRPEHDPRLDRAAERLFLEFADHAWPWREVPESGRRWFRRLAAAALGIPLAPRELEPWERE